MPAGLGTLRDDPVDARGLERTRFLRRRRRPEHRDPRRLQRSGIDDTEGEAEDGRPLLEHHLERALVHERRR